MNIYDADFDKVDIREVYDTPRFCGGPLIGPSWADSIGPDPFDTVNTSPIPF